MERQLLITKLSGSEFQGLAAGRGEHATHATESSLWRMAGEAGRGFPRGLEGGGNFLGAFGRLMERGSVSSR